MIKRSTLLVTVLALAAGITLFVVKYKVQALEDELAALRVEVSEAQVAIHVLRAEWSHLTDPQRLASLNEHHLGLVPLGAGHYGAIQDIPLRGPSSSDQIAETDEADSQ